MCSYRAETFMRHIQITAFIVRLLGLVLAICLFRRSFDTGFYADEPAFPNFSREPSFRFVGIYLLQASHGFYVVRFCVELLGSLLLLASPRMFARLLWTGIRINGGGEQRR